MAGLKHSRQRLKPNSLFDLVREAADVHKQGDLKAAHLRYREILSVKPREATTLRLLTLLQLQTGQFAGALETSESLVAIDPRNVAAILTSGVALHRLGRLPEALSHYNRVLAIDSESASALNNRGNVYRDLGNPRQAIADYTAALVAKPDYQEAVYNRGLALIDLGRFDEALGEIDKALLLNPRHVEGHNARGNLLIQLERPLLALQSYDAALACDPNHAGALNNRGILLKTLKRHEEALENFDRALLYAPSDAVTHNNRGNVLVALGHSVEALASYQHAIALNPGYAEAYNNLGLLRGELGQFEAAEAAIESAVRLAPGTARFYYNLTEAKTINLESPHLGAMERLAAGMAGLSAPDQIDLHFALGKAYADTGEPVRSFAHLEAGNALKFRRVCYDEAGQLDLLARVAAAFTSRLMRAAARPAELSRTPVFIIGMPRSGSTLIEQILANHPQIFAAGEIDDFDKAIQDLAWRVPELSPEALATLPPAAWAEAGAIYNARLGRIAGDAFCVTNKKLNNFRIAGLIHLALPEARIIHARRHPADTCVSCFSKNFADDLPYTSDLGALGRYYRAYDSLMAHWHAVLPGGIMLDVQYEELIADLEGGARKILSHCGLDWNPRCLEFYKAARPVRTASKTQVRRPVFHTSVGRWKQHEARLGPLLAALGAPCSGDPAP